MTQDSVSEELVEIAYRAMTDANDKDFISETGMRAAINAIAPRLRAQGMREAVALASPEFPYGDDYGALFDMILARAAALDPQVKP
jgi:hypothetical protein